MRDTSILCKIDQVTLRLESADARRSRSDPDSAQSGERLMPVTIDEAVAVAAQPKMNGIMILKTLDKVAIGTEQVCFAP